MTSEDGIIMAADVAALELPLRYADLQEGSQGEAEEKHAGATAGLQRMS